MNHRALLTLLILAVLPRGAHAADSWVYRPGLWELTTVQDYVLRPVPTNLPPDRQAQMQAFQEKLKPPAPFTEQFCVDKKEPPMKSAFDPANQPAGVCSEKVISENSEAREIEDDCQIPVGDGSASPEPRVRIPIRSLRHVLLSGDGAGAIDRAEIAMHKPRESLTQNFRWLGAECGAVKATPRN